MNALQVETYFYAYMILIFSFPEELYRLLVQ